MRIDLRTRLVHVFDREVQLYRRKFDLLVLLARNPESTYSTASIRDALGANCELNSINMYMGLVRSKIGDDPNYPQWVATVEGRYRFVGKNSPARVEEEAEVPPIEHWRSANDGRLLVIDRVSETAAVDGEPAHLSKKEFAILSALTSRQGGVWENEELSQLVLGVGFVESSRALSTYMNKIRSVLGDSPKSTSWIKTVRGVGYRMIGTLEPVDLAAYDSSNDDFPHCHAGNQCRSRRSLRSQRRSTRYRDRIHHRYSAEGRNRGHRGGRRKRRTYRTSLRSSSRRPPMPHPTPDTPSSNAMSLLSI